MEYLTPQQMRDAEARAASFGLGPTELMENAGSGGREGRRRCGMRGTAGRNVLILCGLGNNGGDGLVAARLLGSGWRVHVLLLGQASDLKTGKAARNWSKLRAPVEWAEAHDRHGLLARREWFAWADVILDAILGTGVRGEVREPMASAVRLMNESGSSKVAIDVPSGLDPLTGGRRAPRRSAPT